jgi:hypothetical protein
MCNLKFDLEFYSIFRLNPAFCQNQGVEKRFFLLIAVQISVFTFDLKVSVHNLAIDSKIASYDCKPGLLNEILK